MAAVTIHQAYVFFRNLIVALILMRVKNKYFSAGMDYSFEKITVTQVMYQVALHLKDKDRLNDHIRKQLLELLDTYEPETQQCTSFSLVLQLHNCLLHYPISKRCVF